MVPTLSTEELQAFVGEDCDYYPERWEDREGARQGIRKFHRAALLFGLGWLYDFCTLNEQVDERNWA